MSAPAARTVLHLVRGAAPPPAVADRGWVVYLDRLELVVAGSAGSAGPAAPPPPLPAGPIDHEQLVALAFAADLVVTW